MLDWLPGFRPPANTANTATYAAALDVAVYAEAVRFDRGWRRRSAGLLPIEREYAERKLARARTLFAAGERYELLLALMELVEDAETLTAREQPAFPLHLLAFRDHLRDVLASRPYAAFAAGEQGPSAVLDLVSRHLKSDLGLDYDLRTLAPARNLTNLENYLQRAEWQYYKSSARGRGGMIPILVIPANAGIQEHTPRHITSLNVILAKAGIHRTL